MHPYSNDTSRIRTLLLALVVAAILLAWGLGRVMATAHITTPWWLDTPAVVGFYGILWQLYDRWLWRLRIGSRTLSGIPNYNGSWTGSIRSSHDSARSYPARLTIRQTASRVLVELHTERSRSVSQMAMLCAGSGSEHGLVYLYTNKPRHIPEPEHPDVQAAGPRTNMLAMTPHEGISRLLLAEDRTTLDGDYQNDRHRQTYGTLSFKEKVTS